MGNHPPETAPLASMRAHMHETVALLWQARWDIAKTAVLIPALFTAMIAPSSILLAVLGDGMSFMVMNAFVGLALIFVSWVCVPAILLHSLAQRARGEAVPYRHSCSVVLRRIPQLAALSWRAFSYYIGILIGITVLVPMALLLTMAIALGPEQFDPDFERYSPWFGVSSSIAGFIALAFLLRKGTIAPALVLVDGMAARQAWNRSSAVLTWHRVYAALPFFLPLIAGQPLWLGMIWAPALITLMEAVGFMLFLAMFLILPPLSAVLGAVGSVIPWRDSLKEPDGPRPKSAPRPRPAPTHSIPTTGLTP